MTYQTLNDVIKRLAEKSRVPAEQMQQFEVATGMRGQRETVMLCGLMPQTQYGARPLIAAGCELVDNIILADTERVDCYDVRHHDRWQDDFYDFGISLGLAHDYLTKKLLIVFGGQGRMQGKED
jgi:hypothetical protein